MCRKLISFKISEMLLVDHKFRFLVQIMSASSSNPIKGLELFYLRPAIFAPGISVTCF